MVGEAAAEARLPSPDQGARPVAAAITSFYTACYCEENCILLARHLRAHGCPLDRLFAVFVSNPQRQTAVWRQRTSPRREGLQVWDYHVLLLEGLPAADVQAGAAPALVWDLDSSLPCPCPLPAYAARALLPPAALGLPPRRYRVVPAPALLRHFSSDRRHMRLAGGGWASPPPGHACIVSETGSTHTLPQYLETGGQPEAAAAGLRRRLAAASAGEAGAAEDFGVVATEAALLECFGATGS